MHLICHIIKRDSREDETNSANSYEVFNYIAKEELLSNQSNLWLVGDKATVYF